VLGGLGFLSMYVAPSPEWLKLGFVLVGVAWASILSMPYALLAGCLEEKRMGVFMGLFNMFIVLPQITAALVLGPLVKQVFANHAIYALVLSGCSLLVAAVFLLRVSEHPTLEPVPEPAHG
jgi:maltose/moltooligosaccharide transporter